MSQNTMTTRQWWLGGNHKNNERDATLPQCTTTKSIVKKKVEVYSAQLSAIKNVTQHVNLVTWQDKQAIYSLYCIVQEATKYALRERETLA